MDKDEVLKKLEEACINLQAIGNVVEFKKNNPNGLFGLIVPVIQYYNFIQSNFKNDEFVKVEAMGFVLGVGKNNPSLKGVIDYIVSPNKNKKKEEKEEMFDKTAFINKVTSIVEEFKSQNSINTSTIDDSEYFLEKCMEELNINKEQFTQMEYEQLSDMIRQELDKIKRFYEVYENKSSAFKM